MQLHYKYSNLQKTCYQKMRTCRSSLLLLLFLYLDFFFVPAKTYTNLTLGSMLFPFDPQSFVASPASDFRFGFQPLPYNASFFILAVWFDKTSPQTIVWFATDSKDAIEKRDPIMVTYDSILRLVNGSLSLIDSKGKELWNPGPTNATTATLLDSGNLILSDVGGDILWQSFDVPTDTLLPNQSLAQGSVLLSKLTDSDFSAGRFKLSARNDGKLAIYPLALPIGNIYDAIWTSNTSMGTTVFFNTSGSIDYEFSDGTHDSILSSVKFPLATYYQHATLDPDGVFRLYFYLKNTTGTNNSWSVAGQLPRDGCRIPINIGGSTGRGMCGFNAYCNSDSHLQRLDCECPPRYSFLDAQNKYKGCIPDFPLQSCETDQTDEFEFIELANTNWLSGHYEHYTPVDKDQCKAFCLADCFCAAASFQGSDCWKKKLPLTNGQKGEYVRGQISLIKVPSTNNSYVPQPRPQPQPSKFPPIIMKKQSGLVITGAALLGCSGLVLLIFLVLIISRCSCFRSRKISKNIEMDDTVHGLNLKKFTYAALENATNNFREELGCGAFGTVYKGELETGSFIAVKRLHRLSKDAQREFLNEVRSIGQTHHKNLVRLFGFCSEGNTRMLVYEYMSRGSLTSYLFGETRPSWSQRAQIAVSIARGLRYLHEECDTQIIHCDIKPQNILLDHNLVPKISDFGLAKLLHADRTQTSTYIRGTKGYVAPEWFKNTPVTTKVDIYSFGVMLLEIICCRKNLDHWNATGENDAEMLTYWASDCVRDGRIDLLVEGDDEAMSDMASVERFIRVAVLCVHEEPSRRPFMRDVASMLEGVVPVYAPSDSFYSSV